jgi:hypothetical protein
MACGGCRKRGAARKAAARVVEDGDFMSKYANLTDRQIRARLEIYKRKYCGDCAARYECDYTKYVECRKSKQ